MRLFRGKPTKLQILGSALFNGSLFGYISYLFSNDFNDEKNIKPHEIENFTTENLSINLRQNGFIRGFYFGAISAIFINLFPFKPNLKPFILIEALIYSYGYLLFGSFYEEKNAEIWNIKKNEFSSLFFTGIAFRFVTANFFRSRIYALRKKENLLLLMKLKKKVILYDLFVKIMYASGSSYLFNKIKT